MGITAHGPEKAKIMLVGDKPTEADEKSGIPFSGLYGNVLNSMLEEAGIDRGECRVTYLDKGNGVEDISMEIASCGPNIVVPFGELAFQAVSGLKGIGDYRGSILERGGYKVIGCISPSTISKEWMYRPITLGDLKRVREQSEFPETRVAYKDLVVCYEFNQAIEELKLVEASEYAAFDIETESNQITAIGFSIRQGRAICIPFWFGDSGSLWTAEQERELWRCIRRILEEGRIKKIAHNAAYDIGELRRTLEINTKGLWLDTMAAFHVLQPEMPKGLGFLTSVYTDQPYYKYQLKSADMDTYFRYCAKDCVVTFEIAFKLENELREEGLEKFYGEYVHKLIEPLIAMEAKGVRYDNQGAITLRKEIKAKCKELQESLNKEVGYEINVGSNKQMCKWLYEELKLKVQMHKNKVTGKTNPSANEDALEKLSKIYDIPALGMVMELRRLSKLLSTYLDIQLDADKRIRCSYNITGTETGRLSSSQTLRGTGANLQNIPNGIIKQLFLSDDNKVLIDADLSQAEARVVAYLACDKRFIQVFEAGGDIHRKNASNIFGKKECEISHGERELAKRVVHASNYGMGPRTFANTAGIPEEQAKRLLNQYFAGYPRIKSWHMQIRDTLNKSRILTTPLGRRRIFYSRFSDSLVKEGLAFIPQSTVADIVNRALIALYNRGVDVLLQVHDSIVVQCDANCVEETIRIMREELERPVLVNGNSLSIPSGFKVGTSWGKMEKYSKK